MTGFLLRRFGAALAILILTFALEATATSAAKATAFLSGTVTDNGIPVPGATVTVSGNRELIRTTTDAQGRFSFAALVLGTYAVTATAKDRSGVLNVDLGSGGATIAIAISSLKQIGSVAVARSSPVRGSGADVLLDATDLTRATTSDSFSETLIQLPGTARGANGVVHMNGDHGVIDYVVDGVPLPQALNREIGSEIDPNDISFLDAIEGAYPAQYGLRFGSVLNITTRAGTGPAGFDGSVRYGSYGDIDQSLGYHTPIGNGGGIDFAVRNQATNRALDPPDFASPHNSGSDANQFVRVTLPSGRNDFTDLTLIHSFRTFQIPNDVEFGEPATTDDNETQDDTFLSAQFRHALGSTGSLSFGPSLKVSHIRDFGDPSNDWAYGEALNVAPAPFGNGGASTDCATALGSGNFAPTTCAYSLADDKTSLDYILNGDLVQRLGNHELRAGVGYDLTRVDKLYNVTLQPNNFLAPLQTPSTPGVATSVVDNNPNVGNTYQSYVQDSWRLSKDYEADLGLRYDYFSIRSADFAQGFGGFSPRLKVTRFFGPRASIYAYVGRFFEPFSFENVDPRAAQLLNLPLQPAEAQFDLKPERDTQLEFGGHVPAGAGELGFRIWQKNASNLIDDTQVGVTALHQDINYTLGRLSAETLDYTLPLPRNGRMYANLNHTISVNSGCETQLLAPCFGAPTIFTPADHEQRWSITGGFLINDSHGGWFSGDAEYGSGLSSGICQPATDDCKATPHTIFALEKGFALGKDVALTVRVLNLLNDRYYVTLLNAQGTHFAPPRTLDVGIRFGR
jgi:outer membrane receptor protein involved in Fe transport